MLLLQLLLLLLLLQWLLLLLMLLVWRQQHVGRRGVGPYMMAVFPPRCGVQVRRLLQLVCWACLLHFSRHPTMAAKADGCCHNRRRSSNVCCAAGSQTAPVGCELVLVVCGRDEQASGVGQEVCGGTAGGGRCSALCDISWSHCAAGAPSWLPSGLRGAVQVPLCHTQRPAASVWTAPAQAPELARARTCQGSPACC